MSITARIEKQFKFQQPLVWRNCIGLGILYLVMVYSIVVHFIIRPKFGMQAFVWTYGYLGGLSITTGAHRLWTHKTYKASLPLRIWIMFWYMSSGMYSLVQWVRDHRSHHKFTDTDADPHNSNRGFIFSHCGWLVMKRHPDLKEKGKVIDVSDVMEDPVVRFSEKYYVPLLLLCHTVIPTLFGYYILKESLFDSIMFLVLGRYIILLNSTWLINSWAHHTGYRPYNKNIKACQSNLLAMMTMGEGWHNFHHTFPWDYRVGELGQWFQIGTRLIDFYALLGLAYDRKTVPADMVKRVLEKNGELGFNEEIPEEEIHLNNQGVKITNRKVRMQAHYIN